ncbi:Clp protease N-terminal domain-containing protein [Actinosynnema sp. NPDC023794]
MSDQAGELVSDAVRQTGQWGRADVGTEQLLWAATRQSGTRALLARAGADPDELAGRIGRQSTAGEPRQGPVRLTPAAKRALLDAHQVSRGLGSSCTSARSTCCRRWRPTRSPAPAASRARRG